MRSLSLLDDDDYKPSFVKKENSLFLILFIKINIPKVPKYNPQISSDVNLAITAIIDDDTNIVTLSVASFNTNIESYINSNIPKHLDEKYNYIKDKLTDK